MNLKIQEFVVSNIDNKKRNTRSALVLPSSKGAFEVQRIVDALEVHCHPHVFPMPLRTAVVDSDENMINITLLEGERCAKDAKETNEATRLVTEFLSKQWFKLLKIKYFFGQNRFYWIGR